MGEFSDDRRPRGVVVIGPDPAVDSLDVVENDSLAVVEAAEPCLLVFRRRVVPGCVPQQFGGDPQRHMTAPGRLDELGHGRAEEFDGRVIEVRISLPQRGRKAVGRGRPRLDLQHAARPGDGADPDFLPTPVDERVEPLAGRCR